MALEDNIKKIDEERIILMIRRQQEIESALNSKDPVEVVKAMQAVEIERSKANGDDRKAFYIDPDSSYNDWNGYKQRPTSMSYEMMWGMSRTPVINAIIKRRKHQVAEFAKPQKDRHSTGFIIRKKGSNVEDQHKLNKADRAMIDEATEFILNCGSTHSWNRDGFDTFLRKGTEESLTFDQLNYEVVRSQGGVVEEFVMVSAETIRRSDLYMLDLSGAGQEMMGYNPFQSKSRAKSKMVAGYVPHAVQIYMDSVRGEFYPWELEFALRNPMTRLQGAGYGRSELEDMVMVTTSLLWSDQYNQNFFRIGSSPKGILRVKGGSNNPRLEEFKQKFRAQVSGVQNSHRVPVIDSETAEWIDLQKSHRDMEFSKWQEYNIKLACALYTIDPDEIGFEGSGSSGKPMFEGNNASRLKFSRDNGLGPLLSFWQGSINKMALSQRYPDLVFEFVGLNAQSEEDYNKKVKEEVTTFKTVNEVRAENNMKPVKHGDVILDSVYMQGVQAAAMNENGMGEDGGMDFGMGDEEEEDGPTDGRGFTPRDSDEEEGPFKKAINDMMRDFEKGNF